jgi:hypothetical protein
MTLVQIHQRYSARHLTPHYQSLAASAESMLLRQLKVLRAVNFREGYPRANFPRVYTYNPTFLRSAIGNKVYSVLN